jgi:hypothetical protein
MNIENSEFCFSDSESWLFEKWNAERFDNSISISI